MFFEVGCGTFDRLSDHGIGEQPLIVMQQSTSPLRLLHCVTSNISSRLLHGATTASLCLNGQIDEAGSSL